MSGAKIISAVAVGIGIRGTSALSPISSLPSTVLALDFRGLRPPAGNGSVPRSGSSVFSSLCPKWISTVSPARSAVRIGVHAPSS